MDVISMRDFSKEGIVVALDAAEEVKEAIHSSESAAKFEKKHGRSLDRLLEGLFVATTFDEKSTRTSGSHRAAAMRTGAHVDGFPSKDFTSLMKGETWAETMAMYATWGMDVLVMRTKEEGAPRFVREYLIKVHQQMVEQHGNREFAYHVPMVINGGDGKNQHPTQCFLDLFTIREIARKESKGLEGLHVALLNDLANGRTLASLMSIAHYFAWTLHFAYPDKFGPQKRSLSILDANGVAYHDHGQNFEEAMAASLIAYQSRPQKERVAQEGVLFEHIKRCGQITRALYDKLGDKAPYLLHPKPVDMEMFEEIAHDMFFHPKNWTNTQASNGLYVRIALLALGLGRMPFKYEGKNRRDPSRVMIEDLPLSRYTKHKPGLRSGHIEGDGVVLDHIPPGRGRRLSGVLGLEREGVPKNITDYLESKDGREPKKDLIKIHCAYGLSAEQQEAMALLAPGITVSIVESGNVVRKYHPHLGNLIVDRVNCENNGCISRVKKEHVTPKHWVRKVNGEMSLECFYCEDVDTVNGVYEQERFRYIEKKHS